MWLGAEPYRGAWASGEQVGMETFRMCRDLIDGVVLVDNSAISAAIKDVFNETRSILEPAGAVAVAGAKAYLKRHGLQVLPHSQLLCVILALLAMQTLQHCAVEG